MEGSSRWYTSISKVSLGRVAVVAVIAVADGIQQCQLKTLSAAHSACCFAGDDLEVDLKLADVDGNGIAGDEDFGDSAVSVTAMAVSGPAVPLHLVPGSTGLTYTGKMERAGLYSVQVSVGRLHAAQLAAARVRRARRSARTALQHPRARHQRRRLRHARPRPAALLHPHHLRRARQRTPLGRRHRVPCRHPARRRRGRRKQRSKTSPTAATCSLSRRTSPGSTSLPRSSTVRKFPRTRSCRRQWEVPPLTVGTCASSSCRTRRARCRPAARSM